MRGVLRGADEPLGITARVAPSWGGEGTKFELGVDAQRRESSLQGGTDHGALARATMRW